MKLAQLRQFFAAQGQHLLIALFILLLSLFFLFGGVIPNTIAFTSPPIKLRPADLANFQADTNRRYLIAPDESFPIDVIWWFETHYGLFTTSRGSDSYYGLYQIGDYYLFHSADTYDELFKFDESMIVHIYPMSQKDFEEIRSLASIFPETTLPFSVSPAVYTNFGSIITMYVFLQILMIEAMRYEYNRFAQVNPKFPRWKYGIVPWSWLGKPFMAFVFWLSAYIKRGLSWLFTWLTQPKFMQAYGDAYKKLLPQLRRLGGFLYALLSKTLSLLGKILNPLGNFLASFWTTSEGEDKSQVKSSKNYKIEILDDEPPQKPKS